MKRFFGFLAAAAVLLLAGCSKYDELAGRVDDLDRRVTTLEDLCRQMNENIQGLQGLVAALEQNDFVTGVTPVVRDGSTVGYTITFSKSEPVTIYHGEKGDKGDDGYTPVVGVKQDSDGNYYWTVDGDWLTDAAGRKIQASGVDGATGEKGDKGADGVTPQLKIEAGYWYVSYDNGKSWKQLGKASGEDGAAGKDGDSFFEKVDVTNPDYVIFVLADGTQIQLPRYQSLSIAFDEADLLAMLPNTTREIHYTVKSDSSEEVEVEVLTSADLKAKVVADTALEGVIEVATGDVVDEYSKMVVFVSNGEKVIMRRFAFEEAGLTVEGNALKQVAAEGSEVTLEFLTNLAFEVLIPQEAQSWISLAPETRAMAKQTVALVVAPNTGDARSASVTVQTPDGVLALEYRIEQDGLVSGTAVEVLNLTPDFIAISGIEKGGVYSGKATLRIAPSTILSAGIYNYHLQHIHVHVNDAVYIPDTPIADGESLSELELEVEVPEGDFTLVACYSVQQQFSDTGYTMTLEENASVKLYGVDPAHKYKYFDCYLLTEDAYTITDIEFRVGGGAWRHLKEVTGCSYERSESVDNVYQVSVRPDYQDVTGDVELRVTGAKHGRFSIAWENATAEYLDLEKSVLPSESIDGETVTAELWINEGYYLASAKASVSGLELSVISRAYVRFTMPAEDVTITLDIREEIPLTAVKGEHIVSAEFYTANDVFYGVPATTGVPGEKTYLFAKAEEGYKPAQAVIEGGEGFDFVFYAESMFYAAVDIPADATALKVKAEAEKAYVATGDEYVYFSAGHLYAEGESVSVTVRVPDGERLKTIEVKTTDGSTVPVVEDLPYANFVMPASDVYVTTVFESLGGDSVSVIAYFDEDRFEVRSSTNYNWDFAEGFTVERGRTFYLSVYDYEGDMFYVGVKIGEKVDTYAADFDADMGEYSFGKALVADDDVVIKVGGSRDEVAFDGAGGGDNVSVIAYFDEDRFEVRSSTNYNWDFAEGFTVERGKTFYLSVYDYEGDMFYVGVKIGEKVDTYAADFDADMGEYSFGKALVADDDVVIKVGGSRDEVAFDGAGGGEEENGWDGSPAYSADKSGSEGCMVGGGSNAYYRVRMDTDADGNRSVGKAWITVTIDDAVYCVNSAGDYSYDEGAGTLTVSGISYGFYSGPQTTNFVFDVSADKKTITHRHKNTNSGYFFALENPSFGVSIMTYADWRLQGE